MGAKSNVPILDLLYAEQAARDYCATLPLKHFMESTPQQTQRKVTVASFELVHADRPDVWCYNELLIQYPQSERAGHFGRVIPDNLIVLHDRELNGTGSFTTTLEQARLFMALEYVSEGSKRKDYVDNMARYEQDVRMPYYLLFEPEKKLLTLYRRSAKLKRFVSVKPNAAERYPIPKLELEVGLYEDWMRFWFRGRMLPLPAELDEMLEHTAERLRAKERELSATEQKLGQTEQKLGQTEQKLSTAEAEIARLKAELAKRSPKG
jgi:Uma2 family endonuclease